MYLSLRLGAIGCRSFEALCIYRVMECREKCLDDHRARFD